MTESDAVKKGWFSEELIQLSPHVWAPERITRNANPRDEKLTVNVSVECRWSPESGKYEIEEMRVTPLSGFPPISSQAIRAVAVGSLLRSASRGAVLFGVILTPVGEMRRYKLSDELYPILGRLKEQGPSSRETLEWVALVYEIANIEDDKPTATVSREFGISLRTASNWVRAAREQGLLGGDG